MKNIQKLILAVTIFSMAYQAQQICRCVGRRGYNPSCGANGKTYFNNCFRECDEVLRGYDGVCTGCNCPDVLQPVCGDDGFSYINSCEANCHKAVVVHQDRCGRNCNCERFPTDEVCGTDGTTYRNQCEL